MFLFVTCKFEGRKGEKFTTGFSPFGIMFFFNLTLGKRLELCTPLFFIGLYHSCEDFCTYTYISGIRLYFWPKFHYKEGETVFRFGKEWILERISRLLLVRSGKKIEDYA